MCWVMPPASPSDHVGCRGCASSSDVLPWSTWPITTVTTGGRGTKSSSLSGESSKRMSSSVTSTNFSQVMPNSDATISAVSKSISWLIVAIVPSPINFMMTSAVVFLHRLGKFFDRQRFGQHDVRQLRHIAFLRFLFGRPRTALAGHAFEGFPLFAARLTFTVILFASIAATARQIRCALGAGVGACGIGRRHVRRKGLRRTPTLGRTLPTGRRCAPRCPPTFDRRHAVAVFADVIAALRADRLPVFVEQRFRARRFFRMTGVGRVARSVMEANARRRSFFRGDEPVWPARASPRRRRLAWVSTGPWPPALSARVSARPFSAPPPTPSSSAWPDASRASACRSASERRPSPRPFRVRPCRRFSWVDALWVSPAPSA
jgi:hypothetical protein